MSHPSSLNELPEEIISQLEQLESALQSVASSLYLPIGLVNTTNTCFMNVVLHALMRCKYMWNYLVKMKEMVEMIEPTLLSAHASSSSAIGGVLRNKMPITLEVIQFLNVYQQKVEEKQQWITAQQTESNGLNGEPSTIPADDRKESEDASSATQASAREEQDGEGSEQEHEHDEQEDTAASTQTSAAKKAKKRKKKKLTPEQEFERMLNSLDQPDDVKKSKQKEKNKNKPTPAQPQPQNNKSNTQSSSKSSASSSSSSKAPPSTHSTTQQSSSIQPTLASSSPAAATNHAQDQHDNERNSNNPSDDEAEDDTATLSNANPSSTSSSAPPPKKQARVHSVEEEESFEIKKNVSKSSRRKQRQKVAAKAQQHQHADANSVTTSLSTATMSTPSVTAQPAPSPALSSSVTSSKPSPSQQPLHPSFPQLLYHFHQNKLGQQEDACEFLQILCEILQQEWYAFSTLWRRESNGRMEEAEDEWQEIGKHNKAKRLISNITFQSSPISLLFSGKLKTTLNFHSHARSDSVSYQPFFVLHLDLPSHTSGTGTSKAKNSIESILDAYMLPNRIEGYKRSNTVVEASSFHSLDMDNLPPILVLHLKRFDNENGQIYKLQQHVQFQSDLNIKPSYLSSQGATAHLHKITTNYQYALASIIVHHGSSAKGGHYTCYLRQKDASGKDEWYCVDDTRVYAVSPHLVYQQQAYLLFYEKKEIDRPGK